MRRNKYFKIQCGTCQKYAMSFQGKVVKNTLNNLGMNNLKNIRQGKYFEIEIDDDSQQNAEKNVSEMCEKLLANLTIEDYKINKL